MPWKERSVMEERLQFVTGLCREIGISRKTGYKIFDRYRKCGLEGLTDRIAVPVTTTTNFLFGRRTIS